MVDNRTGAGYGPQHTRRDTLNTRNGSAGTVKGKTMLPGRHTSVSTALALCLALILGVAAPPAHGDDGEQGRCIREAVKAGLIGPDLNPGNTNFAGGTAGDDNFTGRTTAGPDVVCGFGGDDFVDTLGVGDVFLSGAGNDRVNEQYGGTFNGDEGNDTVFLKYGGTFNGGAGSNLVNEQYGGTFNGG